MNRQIIWIFITFLLSSCSANKHLQYLNDSHESTNKITNSESVLDYIVNGDILKISIQTSIPEASIPYNKNIGTNNSTTLDVLKLEGYNVSENGINFPVLGFISTERLNIRDLEKKISDLLLEGNHLSNFSVKVRRLNATFTVLGEVNNPGTFALFDEKINIFQALGYAGDLKIDGKRNNITIVRQENGLRKVKKISLTDSDILNNQFFHIKNRDVIIVNPNYSKVKSAGFIGSPSSISSIASILLSLTILLLNN